MFENKMIIIKGAGDIATAVAHKLFSCGFPVIMTEVERPTCVRRNVSFANSIFEGQWTVEGITALKVFDVEEAFVALRNGMIPVMIDEKCNILKKSHGRVLVDCILAKRNTGTSRDDADLVIALGPGFTAGEDVDIVIETNRGHDLGRIITQGMAEPDTGIPGTIQGFAAERVLRSPGEGNIINHKEIGDLVKEGEVLATVSGEAVIAPVDGVLRGLIYQGTFVKKGLKIGDIDPRGQEAFVETISDKGRCIAGAVLEAILISMKQGKL